MSRLLLRLWLAMPNSRALPEGFEVLWGTTAAGAPARWHRAARWLTVERAAGML